MRRLSPLAAVLQVVALGCGSDSTGSFPAGTFTSVSSGFRNTCGILTEGVGFCWGDNGVGQIGNGNFAVRDTLPRAIVGLIVFTSIDGNLGHTCGIRAGGRAYCWGASSDGALGNDSTTTSPIPVEVSGGLNFKAIAVGWTHSCGLTTQGVAYCWGNNDFGKLGADTTASAVGTPVAVAGGHVFRSIAAGQNHTCAVEVSDTLFCWGSNSYGQLGTGDPDSHGTPTPVAGALKFRGVGPGYVHSCGITTAGAVYCWGHNDFGQLGDSTFVSTTSPVKVKTTRGFSAVSVGANHSCAFDATGALYCWGNNGSSQLAGSAAQSCTTPPGDSVPCTSSPIRSADGLSFSSIRAGAFHTCAVGRSGGLHCWGANDYGQIGNGSAGASVIVPFPVADPAID